MVEDLSYVNKAYPLNYREKSQITVSNRGLWHYSGYFITGWQNSNGNHNWAGNKLYAWLPVRVAGKFAYVWSNSDNKKANFNCGNEDNAHLSVSFSTGDIESRFVRDFLIDDFDLILITTMTQRILHDLFTAYEVARKHKRSSSQVMQFEMDREQNLIELYEELISRSYQISTSTCFIYTDTVKREIFAASFRDRVVHHLVYQYLYPLYDTRFIYDSYSCRNHKGTQLWRQRVDYFIRSCTQNYSRDAWILKCDIRGFFMNIDKQILRWLLRSFIVEHQSKLRCDVDWLLWLVEMIVMYDPTTDYIFHGSDSDYDGLPHDKSLFHAKPWCGLPIGNLTSQLFANVYMDVFDRWMKYEMKCKYYGRYVDDFIIVHESKDYLLGLIDRMREFLSSRLWLQLHPNKIYLQHYSHWVKFCWAMVLPHRTYVHRRTITRWRSRIGTITHEPYDRIQSIMNSYLWIIHHHRHYYLTQSTLQQFSYLYPDTTITDDGFVWPITSIQDELWSPTQTIWDGFTST